MILSKMILSKKRLCTGYRGFLSRFITFAVDNIKDLIYTIVNDNVI